MFHCFFIDFLSISDVRGQAFLRPTSQTISFSPQFKNSGHMITFLQRCGLQNTDHVMPFWLFPGPLNVDCLSHLFPTFVKVQWMEKCPLYTYNLRSFTKTTSKDAKASNKKRKQLHFISHSECELCCVFRIKDQDGSKYSFLINNRLTSCTMPNMDNQVS